MGCVMRLYILIKRHVEEIALEHPASSCVKKGKKKRKLSLLPFFK